MVDLLSRPAPCLCTDYPRAAWRQGGHPELKDPMARAFLTYADPQGRGPGREDGWEAEYRRDVWRMRRLGFPGDRR